MVTIGKTKRIISKAAGKKVTEQLTAEGWLVIRFWGDEIKKQPIRCADIVEEAIRKR